MVPQTKVDNLSIDSESSGEVIKDSGLIFGREFVFSIALCLRNKVPDEYACFTDGTITDNDEFDSYWLLHFRIRSYFFKDGISLSILIGYLYKIDKVKKR